ncbi:MAG: 1-deoxy-D-xylulose-5-phosphate reductoisomerase [Oscillospiraceae bacterium]|nr:1-deoxy-D-xylulose-5-phosphate reductoisomerase [Oscillospiraceae bacterium]
MKEIVLLGSTGSIGTQTLEVAKLHNIKIKALSAGRNIALLAAQAREFMPEYVCVADENRYSDLKLMLNDTDIKVLCGKESICELAAMTCDITVNAIVGMAGFLPTLAALNAGNDIALANKETLVVGGEIIMKLAHEKKRRIFPIDSEHSAIFQSLLCSQGNKPKKIILTASGGPFRGYTPEQIKNVTKEQALMHPNWSMGEKITIDSATMMNKGLELIEAVWMFYVPPEKIEIVVHPQSILHSAVEFEDGSVIGQLGNPDMRLPIQFALTYPERYASPAKSLSLTEVASMTFEKANEKAFPCIELARAALKKGGNMPCIMNCANETAVEMFLKDKIKFFEIPEKIQYAMENIRYMKDISPEIIAETERETKIAVLEAI